MDKCLTEDKCLANDLVGGYIALYYSLQAWHSIHYPHRPYQMESNSSYPQTKELSAYFCSQCYGHYQGT